MSASQTRLGAGAEKRCSSRLGATGRPWRLSVVAGRKRRLATALIPWCRINRSMRPRLITDLPVTSNRAAIEKLRWYAQRWKVELFHKILKSGCRVEAARLRTAERLTRLIAVFCVLSWRIFWTTMINRTAPDAPPRSALTEAEITVIDRAVRDRPTIPAEKTLSRYLMKIACLGGYLARAHDRPPGNTVMWRGWSRLTDMILGADLMQPSRG